METNSSMNKSVSFNNVVSQFTTKGEQSFGVLKIDDEELDDYEDYRGDSLNLKKKR